jgi:hypothetical protein
MVFAVNAPTTGNTFDAFQNAAKGGAASGTASGTGGAASATSGTGDGTPPGSGTTTSGLPSSSPNSGQSMSTSASDPSQSGSPGGRKSLTSKALGGIIGSICGLLFLIFTLSLVYCKYYRRRRSLNYTLTDREDQSTQMRQVDEQELSPIHVDPFTLKHASIGVSSSQAKQTFISDQKLPLEIPPGEVAQVSENIDSEQAVDLRNPSDSEDVSRRPSSSAANSLAPSITTTVRQQRLQEQEQASARQLASLEARIGSAEWVSRAEYDVMAAEMGRLRAELSWFRDAQQSDWALGLSDEMPPPY